MSQIQVITTDITKKVLKQLDHKHSITNIEMNMLKVIGRFDSRVVEAGYNQDWLLIQLGSQACIVTSFFLADVICKEKCHREFMEVQKIIILK